jgi:hypothetical protein
MSKEKLFKFWLKNYAYMGLCSLCGQSGIIDTTGKETNGGVFVGRKNYCLCPNGRRLRKASKGKKL